MRNEQLYFYISLFSYFFLFESIATMNITSYLVYIYGSKLNIAIVANFSPLLKMFCSLFIASCLFMSLLIHSFDLSTKRDLHPWQQHLAKDWQHHRH